MDDQQRRDNAATAQGSANLLKAILAAKAGTCVVTPSQPVKLPMDYSNATGPKSDTRNRTGVEPGSLDQVAALMARKKGASDIAKELGITIQKATWMMAGVRKRRTPSELDIAMRAKLWG